MADASTHASTRVTRLVRASRETVYRAFLDAHTLAAWLPPLGMTGEVHALDAREGGTFRVSLTYADPAAARGKTSESTDSFHGRFVRLVPNRQIVEAVELESADAALQGESTLTVTLADSSRGTQITLLHENLPSGLRAKDNETGWQSSLDKLAALVE